MGAPGSKGPQKPARADTQSSQTHRTPTYLLHEFSDFLEEICQAQGKRKCREKCEKFAYPPTF
eukprot:5270921-Prymnesium_polylepis.1